MKILLTGGGTGGHFYPLVAIAEEIYNIVQRDRLLMPELIFMSDSAYDKETLQKEQLVFKKVPSGKIRRYFSLFNITDLFKTGFGILKAIWDVYSDMPDVVFGKGGYASFPPLLAARIFNIPIIIHETDSMPGKVNKWAGKFAKRIAISFPESKNYFPKEKTAFTGVPVRKSILAMTPEEAEEVFLLESKVPTILILGGSQGAQKINEVIVDSLVELIKNYQIIHQCGKNNEKEIKERANVIIENSIFKNRYHLYPYLSDQLLKNAFSVADIVVSRAGGTAIYEIASRGLASIIIPIKKSAQDHQRENAYSYKRAGGCEVLEEDNLSPHVLQSEIKRILADEKKRQEMKTAALNFAKPEAAKTIAQEIINLGLEHAE